MRMNEGGMKGKNGEEQDEGGDFTRRKVYTNLNLRTSSDINEVSEIARAPKII